MADCFPLNADYVGCSGRVALPANGVGVNYECVPFVPFIDRVLPTSLCYLRQWSRPGAGPVR